MNFRHLNQSNLDALLCSNPFLTVMIGDFNAKSKDWCSIDITSFEGSELDFLTSQFGLSQIIKEPTHILDNSRSCIDLIFTSQPNMVIDSGVHASLQSHCHHQVIYAKFDLKVIYMRGRCGISNMLTMIISKGQLTSLIGNPL